MSGVKSEYSHTTKRHIERSDSGGGGGFGGGGGGGGGGGSHGF